MELLDVLSLEWVSVSLKHGGSVGEGQLFSLFLGEGGSTLRGGELGAFLSLLLQEGASRVPLKQACISYR